MPWTNPKTNWTSNEAYNFGDINRVESNMEYVRSELIGIGYTVPSLTFITNRNILSYDLLSSVNRIESNMEAIKLFTPPGWLDTITWTADTRFTNYHANRWESNVQLLHDYVPLVESAFRRCGAIVAGQGVPI